MRMIRLETVILMAALVMLTNTAGQAAEPTQIPLWKDGAPGAKTKPQDEPVLFLSRPAADMATRRGGDRLPRRRLWPSRHGKGGQQDRRVAQLVRCHGVCAPLSPHAAPATSIRRRCSTDSGRFAPCGPAPRSGASIPRRLA